MKRMFVFAFVVLMAMGALAQMNVWENGGLSAQYTIENVDSVTFGITSVTPSSGTGKDGITPLLKIEDDYWYVSYDEGATWKKEGRATGDSMFQSVTQDAQYVYFTLSDGSKFKFEKSKDNQTIDGNDFIEFRDLAVKSGILSSTDTNGDGEISFTEAQSRTGKFSWSNNSAIRSFKEFQYFTNITSCQFSKCTNLFEIILPESIDTIPTEAFGNSSSSYACTNLKSINIPKNCKYIGNYAFANTALYNITIPDGCDYIGEYAFYYTKLKSIEVPNSVQTIGSYAFYISNDTLESFRFPENFTKGGSNIFYYLPKTIYWDAINCQSYQISNKTSSDATNLSVVMGDKVEFIPENLCKYLSKLENINLPNSVKTIGANAFYQCSSLSNVSFPEGLELINAYAFYGCSSLQELRIPDNVQIIDTYAFYYCSKATEITLGKGVEIINDYAFYGTNPTKIYCSAIHPPYIGTNVLPTSAIIYVPRESVSEYREAWSSYASKIMGYDFE